MNGKSRLQQTQEDVEEVKEIMLDNMAKANERSGKLEDLEDRAEELKEKGRVFQKKTQTLKQKKRWENQRMKIIFIIVAVLVGAAILGGIIYAIVSSSGGQ